MQSMGVYDQLKKVLQDVIAPELQVLSTKMDGLDRKIASVDDGDALAPTIGVDVGAGADKNSATAPIAKSMPAMRTAPNASSP